MQWHFGVLVCPALSVPHLFKQISFQTSNTINNTIILIVIIDHWPAELSLNHNSVQLHHTAALHSGTISPAFVPTSPLDLIGLSLIWLWKSLENSKESACYLLWSKSLKFSSLFKCHCARKCPSVTSAQHTTINVSWEEWKHSIK